MMNSAMKKERTTRFRLIHKELSIIPSIDKKIVLRNSKIERKMMKIRWVDNINANFLIKTTIP